VSTTYIKDPEGFGQRLKQARKNRGCTQADIAFEGCSVAYICRIEKGQRFPSHQITQGLADRLGVTVEWLTSGRENPLFLAIRQVVEEHRSGVEIPNELINRLDLMTLPPWYRLYRDWRDAGSDPEHYPRGVPNPIPAWAKRYYLLPRPERKRGVKVINTPDGSR
jgi:transcriptional regulator with XRE-family HTH domain